MIFVGGKDSLLTCPLDESHRILKSRMQFHLVRCSKNHSLGTRLKCPWNPLHIIDKFAYEDHYTRECEDRVGALESSCLTEEPNDVASVPVTASNYSLPPLEEDWDADPGPVGTYDPFKNTEEKMVMRFGAIGLSKSKKKAWRQAERKRFQELEAKGPIEIKSQPKEKPKVLRQPRTVSKAMSIDSSTIDELNSTKISENDKQIRENKRYPEKLRKPHKFSAALSYNEDLSDKENGAYRKRIVHGIDKSISSFGENSLIDKLPNLRRSSSDTASGISSISTHDNVETLRKTLEKNIRAANINDSTISTTGAQNSALLDEATNLPNLVAPIPQSEDDTVVALSQRLAELTTEQNKIDEMKAYLIKQISRYEELPKLVSSNASHASLNLQDENHYDVEFNASSSTEEIDSPSVKQSNNFTNVIPKCAANFSKFRQNKNRPSAEIGRETLISFDASRDDKPSLKTEKEIEGTLDTTKSSSNKETTRPFLIKKATSEENISQRTSD